MVTTAEHTVYVPFIHATQPLKIDSKIKADIRMIQMRNYMDPKRYGYLPHYSLPIYFTSLMTGMYVPLQILQES